MFDIDIDVINKNYSCNITNNNRKLVFNLKYYSIYCNGEKASDIFKYLNRYLESRPDTKNRIFILYEDILNTFRDVWDTEQLERNLSNKTISLLDSIEFYDVVNWIKNQSDIVIPKVFVDEYNEDISKDLLGTRERTYLKDDYRELLALSIILRTMMPIWSEFIVLRQKELGTIFKEYRAFSLTSKAKIFSNDSYIKLYNYVERIVEKAVSQNTNTFKVIAGVSSEDLPDWTIASTIVRRLVTGSLETERNSENSLITNVYGFAFSKMLSPTSVANTLRDKKVSDSGADENDKISSLENYKITSELSAGTIVELDYSVSDYDKILNLLAPGISNDLVDDCFSCRPRLLESPLSDPQITILKWIMSPVINPRAMMYLNKGRVVDLLCMTSAILWHQGHKYLSLIISGTMLEDDDVVSIGSTTGKSKISQEMKDKIDTLYPYKSIKKSIKLGEVYSNPVLDSINTVAQDISSQIWVIGMPSKYIEEHFGELNTMPSVPYDIRNVVADLVVNLVANLVVSLPKQ